MNQQLRSWSTSAAIGKPEANFWSKTQESSFPVSVWWPGLDTWGLAGHNSKQLHGASQVFG